MACLGNKQHSVAFEIALKYCISNSFVDYESESEVAYLCPTLCDPLDYSLPSSSLHRILQARILEWVAISFSRGSS